MTEYFVGTTLNILDELTTAAGAAVNPDTVTISIEHVGGDTSVSASMVNTGEVGSYEYDYTFSEIGTWQYTITATSGTDITVHRGLILIV